MGDYTDSEMLENIVFQTYSDEIRRIVDKIFNSVSVMVEVEKEVLPYLLKALINNIKKRDFGRDYEIKIIGANLVLDDPTYSSAVRSFYETLTSESSDSEKVYLFPHMDLITASQGGGLTGTSKLLLQVLSSFPDTRVVGFFDPNIISHKSVYEYFNVKFSLLGISRDKIEYLLTDSEKNTFKTKNFPPIKLFKYTSGINPVKFRKIINSIIADVRNYHGDNIEKFISSKIKDFISSQGFELPDIDIDRDIGGYEDVKKTLKENILDIIDKMDSFANRENIEKIKELENIIPRGIIFYGPPGTGKTLFAKAIATAINGTIYVISGPEIKSMWYGETEANLRKIFYLARKNAPSVIVFDELDSIASKRESGNTESRADHSLVNQLLTELDGFRKDELVIFVGTTNFIESIDPAILRPGRVELQIKVNYPDREARRKIINIYNKKYEIGLTEDLVEYLVEITDDPIADDKYFTGDHLHSIMRYLKREIVKGEEKITKSKVDEAVDMLVHPVKLPVEDREIIAVHESGHAILSYILIPYRKIRKITVETKSSLSLGMTASEEIKDKYSFNKDELFNQIIVVLGGRAAEKVIFNKYYTGSSDDLLKATRLAELMVKVFGFDETIGPVSLVDERGVEKDGILKDEADRKVRDILKKAEDKAIEILNTYKDKIIKLKDLLLINKTIFSETLEEVLKDGKR